MLGTERSCVTRSSGLTMAAANVLRLASKEHKVHLDKMVKPLIGT